MLHTTRALVLRTIRHGDAMLVLNAYTEDLGLRAMLVRTGKRNARHGAILQPLARIEVVVDDRSDRELRTVRELRLDEPFHHISGDPERATILIFMQELLYRTLREETPDPGLYHFLLLTLEHLDCDTDLSHFPLVFLVQFSRHLGFFPEAAQHGMDRFDLREGRFCKGAPDHIHYLDGDLSAALSALLPCRIGNAPTPAIGKKTRQELLDRLVMYYRIHLPGMGELRSPAVLRQILA